MLLIHQATIINEGESYVGSVLLNQNKIEKVFREEVPVHILEQAQIIPAKGLWLMPGVIDDQVHFREPGLTHKADIASESKAAIAGGVTSFMEMPNTLPQTTTLNALRQKFDRAAESSFANYSFYLGATNDNLSELQKVDSKHVCGLKVFMGSSTGNMLVDSQKALSAIFAETNMLIATHCEKEEIIRQNIANYRNRLGENIPVEYHPLIRSAEACYRSSAEAVELAHKYGTKLHILHISTERELSIFDNKPLEEKRITSEVCVHHLWFSDKDYPTLQTKIKWNPAIKTYQDREALRRALSTNKLDVVATDHAPHLWSEKQGSALKAASGGPLVQHSLQTMLMLVHQGVLTKEMVVHKMCHAPAILFQIDRRGFVREGYYADLVLVNPNKEYRVSPGNNLSKCGWSPFDGYTFSASIEKTILNGQIAFENGEVKNVRGQALVFNR